VNRRGVDFKSINDLWEELKKVYPEDKMVDSEDE
jgi:hypothetical protein